MIVILLYVLTELGYVLHVMLQRKENVVLKMLLGLFYATYYSLISNPTLHGGG